MNPDLRDLAHLAEAVFVGLHLLRFEDRLGVLQLPVLQLPVLGYPEVRKRAKLLRWESEVALQPPVFLFHL